MNVYDQNVAPEKSNPKEPRESEAASIYMEIMPLTDGLVNDLDNLSTFFDSLIEKIRPILGQANSDPDSSEVKYEIQSELGSKLAGAISRVEELTARVGYVKEAVRL